MIPQIRDSHQQKETYELCQNMADLRLNDHQKPRRNKHSKAALASVPDCISHFIPTFLGLHDAIYFASCSKRRQRDVFSGAVSVGSDFCNLVARKVRKHIPQKELNGIQKLVDVKKIRSIQLNHPVEPLFFNQVAHLFPNLEALRLHFSKDVWWSSKPFQENYTFDRFTRLKTLQIADFSDTSVATYLAHSYPVGKQTPLLFEEFRKKITSMLLLSPRTQALREKVETIFCNTAAFDLFEEAIKKAPLLQPLSFNMLSPTQHGLLKKIGNRVTEVRINHSMSCEFLDLLAHLLPNLKKLAFQAFDFSSDGYTFEKFMHLQDLHIQNIHQKDKEYEFEIASILNCQAKTKQKFETVPAIVNNLRKEIRGLILSQQTYSPAFLSQIAGLFPDLERLFVSISNEQIQVLQEFKKLKALWLMNSTFYSSNMKHIPQWIESLTFHQCEYITDGSFQLLDLPNARKISLTGKFNGTCTRFLPSTLRVLSFADCSKLSDAGLLKGLHRFTQLEEVSVNGPVTGQFLEAVPKNIKKLLIASENLKEGFLFKFIPSFKDIELTVLFCPLSKECKDFLNKSVKKFTEL